MQGLWRSDHEHVFGQDRPAPGERRTMIVAAVTAVTMVVEVAAGMGFGSMALLADGLHMGSHAMALGIAAFAYRFARKRAADPRFSFGTGKVNALSGYSGAILLGVFALGMALESLERIVTPVPIALDAALLVAVFGLLVNGASVVILGDPGHHGDDHDHDHEHGAHHHDHNFRAAYLHVLADALTSLLAIGALLAAKYFDQAWLDPAMGLLGAVLITRWAVGLLREAGGVLLDRQADGETLGAIRTAVEGDGDATVADLHVWTIGPGRRAAIIALETARPRGLEEYRKRVPRHLGLAHVTIEVAVAKDRPSGEGG